MITLAQDSGATEKHLLYLGNGVGQWGGKKQNSQETTHPLIIKLPREVSKFNNLPLIEKGGTGQTAAKEIRENKPVKGKLSGDHPCLL